MKSDYRISSVTTKDDIKEFLNLPVRLYKNDDNWIRPLDKDIEGIFDLSKNKLFRTGEAVRWIAKNNDGLTVGRIAAFYEKSIAANNPQPTGGLGFFESENDRVLAFMLFDACKIWLKEKGMDAMDGPVNFGDRDHWWGLLVDGFIPPGYCIPYNFKYYKELFEAYGFRNYFEQYTYHRPVINEGLHPVLKEKAERIFNNPEYSVRHISKADDHLIPGYFATIYNRAWAKFPGVKPVTSMYAKSLFNSIKRIMDRRLIWFCFFKNEPVSFLIMIPEINPIIKQFNGKMRLPEMLKFIYSVKIKRACTSASGLIFGIVPEHQRKGIEGAMVMKFAETAFDKGFPYKEFEFAWIGDFNPSMMHFLEQIGARVNKTHVTYRYLFNPDAPFERSKIVNRRE